MATVAPRPADTEPPAVNAEEMLRTFAKQDLAFRHELLDLDADSTCRPDGFTCPAYKVPGTPDPKTT